MDWKSIAESVAKMGAPLLGGVLLGPAGAAAGAALAAKFGADPNNESDIVQKIACDPNASEKLIELEKIHLQQTQSYLADTANARQREIDLAKSGKEDETTKILALGFTAGFFVWLLAMFFFPSLKNDTVTMGLISAETIILSYYFGSSKDKK